MKPSPRLFVGKGKRNFLLATVFVGLLFVLIGTSYAFFSTVVEKVSVLTLSAGNIHFQVSSSAFTPEGNVVIDANSSRSFEVTVESLNTILAKYTLYVTKSDGTAVLPSDVILQYYSTGNVPTGEMEAKKTGIVKVFIKNNIDLPMTLKLGADGGLSGRTLVLDSNKLAITDLREPMMRSPSSMGAGGWGDGSFYYQWSYSSKTIEVVFTDAIEIPTSALVSWDISEKGDSSVIAWLQPLVVGDNERLRLTIAGDGAIFANWDSSSLFASFRNVTSIDLAKLNTSRVVDMSAMFFECESLKKLDLSNFDTSNVGNMRQMFAFCLALTDLNITSFRTSSVYEMMSMFAYCSSLTSLDISHFETYNVTNMNQMFDSCTNLVSLNLGGLSTSNVTDMGRMFYNCSKLVNLDVSGFSTSLVTAFDEMFQGCSSLTSLNVFFFDTSSAERMSGMFSNCNQLKEVTLGTGWDVVMYGTFDSWMEDKKIYVNGKSGEADFTLAEPGWSGYATVIYRG